MSPAQRDIRRKQQVLEYAKQSGNVRKTCWHYGILRLSVLRLAASLGRDGEAGLVNRRPIARSHPKTTPGNRRPGPPPAVDLPSRAEPDRLVPGALPRRQHF